MQKRPRAGTRVSSAASQNPRVAPIDLLLFGLHLPVARKCTLRIGGLLPHPIAQHARMDIEITRCLRNRHAAIPHQPHRLELELAAECPSLPHGSPPVPV
jgi:hypothetical protein